MIPFTMQAEMFILLSIEANKIVDNPNLTWKDKYDIVFDIINPQIRNTGISFDWYDPDMDYKDDVLAYVIALKDKCEWLKKAVHVYLKTY